MLSTRAWTSKVASMSSKVVGRSGRIYVRDRLLQAHPKNSSLNIYLAHCEGKPYVLKPTSRSIFKFSQELQTEFGNNSRLRIHVDENQEENLLVYEYFRGNLLSMVKTNPDLSIEARKFILREVGLGLNDMHSKQYIHLDLKPNNVMLDWNRNENGEFRIERVNLSDLDCALKLQGEKLLNYKMGNVMWRSPEGQTGKGIGKPSEVFSFGLLCLFTITGAETLHPDFEQLKKDGTEPEDVILYKLLSMFGPVPSELITHVNDQYYGEIIKALSEVVAEEDPSVRFAQWKASEFPNLDLETKNLILRMTNLNPKKRSTLSQVMSDPWWK